MWTCYVWASPSARSFGVAPTMLAAHHIALLEWRRRNWSQIHAIEFVPSSDDDPQACKAEAVAHGWLHLVKLCPRSEVGTSGARWQDQDLDELDRR